MRKTVDVRITDEGRDHGKTFMITEMPAAKAEKWAARALLALAKSGVDIGDVEGAGMAGLAMKGFKALGSVDWDMAEPLMDEMLTCVAIKPDPSKPALTRPLFEGDIEEVTTLVNLRVRIFNLHVNFSTPGVQSNSALEAPIPPRPSTTRMSPARSAR